MITHPLVVSQVGKKYARTMKSALKYGLRDAFAETFSQRKSNGLRNNEFWSLQNVSFNLAKGECLAVLGGNGAGKSTLLKIISGIIAPDQGQVQIHGHMEKIIELSSGLKPSLSGRENIELKAALLKLTSHQKNYALDEIIDFSELEEFIDTPVQFYSSGMKARLGFSLSAAMNPDILIIDEVLAVGDLSFRMKCYEKIDEMRAQSAVILVTHAMNHVARMADSTLVLHKGQVQHHGNVNEGIEIYHQLINTVAKKPKTYEFNPEKVELIVKHNNKIIQDTDVATMLQHGDNLSLNAHVVTEKAVSLSIKLQTRDSELISDWNSIRAHKFFEPNATFSVNLDNLTYAPGIYDLMMLGTDQNGKQHFLKHCLSIDMKGKYLSAVRHQPVATWTQAKTTQVPTSTQSSAKSQ